MRSGQLPEVFCVIAVPVLTAFACDGLWIGVTVIVVSSPFASTIGIALINVLLLPSTPSNSVVSTVAEREVTRLRTSASAHGQRHRAKITTRTVYEEGVKKLRAWRVK